MLVLMLNSEDTKKTRKAVWKEIPELKDVLRRQGKRRTGFRVTDAWTGKDLGCVRDHYSVELESHDVAALVVGRTC
jgi:alpha-galactosidase